MPPPSSGGAHLIQILNILKPGCWASWVTTAPPPSTAWPKHMKLAYADRSEYPGDPDFTKVPVAGLISKAYAKELAASIDPNRAKPATAIKPGQPQRHESEQTTHYSVVDRDGNASP